MLALGHGVTLMTRNLSVHLLASSVYLQRASLQTPVYVLYQVPTIVSAAILLTVRHLRISLPSLPPNCWWELFDAMWEDVWSVCGYIMRLYRERSQEERMRVVRMVNKKEVRRWLDETRS
jgi:cyclin L